MIETMKTWHEIVRNPDLDALSALLDDNAVLISPVVYTPQVGKPLALLYLTAAMHVFANEHFRYVRETHDDQGAILEFETEVDGVYVNGVDMIKWNEAGMITEFKVMLRPLQAVNVIHRKMGEMLHALSG